MRNIVNTFRLKVDNTNLSPWKKHLINQTVFSLIETARYRWTSKMDSFATKVNGY